MLDKALGIGSISQQFFFQTLLKSIVFTSQNYVKQLPQDTSYYITLIKGMAKIDQLKAWINAQISDNTIALDNLPLHFHVVNFNPRRPTQFTFKLFHKTQKTDAQQIGSFPFIPTKYINQFKNNNKKEFIEQFAFNSDITLNFELFIDKSRFALEKIVREKIFGQNANQNEQDRSRQRRRSFKGRVSDDASSMSSQSRRRLMRTGKRQRSRSISRKNKEQQQSEIQKDNKFIKNVPLSHINFVETANLTQSAAFTRDIQRTWKIRNMADSENIQNLQDSVFPQTLTKIQQKPLTMSQILGSQAQSIEQSKKAPTQGLKRDLSSRSLIKRTGSITIKNQQQFQAQKQRLAHEIPYESIRPTSVLRQSRNKMYEDVQLELQKQKQNKKHIKNRLVMIAFMLVCIFFIYLAMHPNKKHRSKKRRYF